MQPRQGVAVSTHTHTQAHTHTHLNTFHGGAEFVTHRYIRKYKKSQQTRVSE
jgi:hypothetical protein